MNLWPFSILQRQKLTPEQELAQEYERLLSGLRERIIYTPTSNRELRRNCATIRSNEAELSRLALYAHRLPEFFTKERVEEVTTLIKISDEYLNTAGIFNSYVIRSDRADDFLKEVRSMKEAYEAKQALFAN